MTCVKCGTTLSETAEFCDKCGAAVESAAEIGTLGGGVDVADATASPEKPERALRLFAGLVAASLVATITFAVIANVDNSRVMASRINSLYPLYAFQQCLTSVIIGCACYLLMRGKRSYKVTALAGVAVSVFSASFHLLFMANIATTLRPPANVMSNLLIKPGLMKMFSWALGNELMFAAVVIGVSAIVMLVAGKRNNKIALVAVGAGTAAVLLRLVCRFYFISRADRVGLAFSVAPGAVVLDGYFMYLTNTRALFMADIFVLALAGGLMVALAIIFVNSLCNFKRTTLVTGMGAKIWFGVVIAVNVIMLIVAFIGGGMTPTALILTLTALSGIALMWLKKRVGWYVFLVGIGLSIMTTFLFPGGTNPNGIALTSRLPSLVYLLNPIITWLFVRRTWRD